MPTPGRPHIRILVCDDVADLRLTLTAMFDLEPGFQVVGEAEDGARAVEEAARLQPDLVLLDLAMPVMDGFTALPRIKEVAPCTRVVVLSALDPTRARAEAIRRGADHYVEKGAMPEELIRVARESMSANGELRQRAEKDAGLMASGE